MKIQPVSKLKPVKIKGPTMKATVMAFLDGPIWEAIQSRLEQNATAGRNAYYSVNVQVPSAAYSDSKAFYSICKEELTKLGYKSEESHDGGGMYSTLAVSWE